jgi:hypothetical protein
MSTYRMSDGTVVKTENATQHWNEDTYWDGNNHISKATGSQWDHQTLYRSRKGRYYVEHTSQWQGSRDSAEWVSNEEAARWLLAQGTDLPPALSALESQISE